MTYKNICVKKTYTRKDGTEKTRWLQVGTLKVTDEGKQFIEINIFPNQDFYVFEQKDREDKNTDTSVGF